MTAEEIIDLDDESIQKAVFQPDSSRLAQNLFNVMHATVNSCFILAGMDGRVVSVDQDKMEIMADRRKIDLVRYEGSVRKFIGAYLKQINKKD